MAKPRTRACLQDGLMLDINRLIRDGSIVPGCEFGPSSIWWRDAYSCEDVTVGIVRGDLRCVHDSSVSIEFLGRQQWLPVFRQARHFGGGQWYFRCPKTGKDCSIVWLPPGGDLVCESLFLATGSCL